MLGKGGTGSTKLKKATSLPSTISSSVCANKPMNLQHTPQSSFRSNVSAKVCGDSIPQTPSASQVETAVLQYLTQHPCKTFSEIMTGLFMGGLFKVETFSDKTELELKVLHAPLVREAIKSLSNDFCIYADGDKYSAL